MSKNKNNSKGVIDNIKDGLENSSNESTEPTAPETEIVAPEMESETATEPTATKEVVVEGPKVDNNNFLANRIAGKIDESGKAISEKSKKEKPVAEEPLNSHLANIHANNNPTEEEKSEE